MATRATIAYADNDGGFYASYLHFDGYPEHVGVILNQRHNSIEKASALVAGGELRCLNASDGEPEYFPRARPPKHLCDRKSLINFARDCDANYLYIFENRHWNSHKL